MSVNETGDLPVTEPVASDLDTIINGAIDTHEGSDAPNGDETTNDISGDDNRDERGRFTAKNTSAAEASEIGATDTVEGADATPKDDPAAVQPIDPPARWSEAEKAEFAKLPRDAQELVASREKARDADYTRKTQDIAEFRKQAEPLVQAVQPYQQYLETLAPHLGMAPAQLVHQVLGFEHRLRTGEPHEQAEVLQQLAQSYGIDLRAVASGEVPQPDPVISQLRQQVSGLTQRLTQYEHQNEAETERQVSSTLADFANAKDANGQPKYPHFSVVRAAMGQLIHDGQVSTLEEAYTLAAKPIEDRIAETLRASAAEAEKRRRESLDKAKRATSPQSTGFQPGGSTAASDLDALIGQAIDQAGLG